MGTTGGNGHGLRPGPRPSACTVTYIVRGQAPGERAKEDPIRYLVLVDGEHYPTVIESALAELASEEGAEIAAVLLVGGKEKLPAASLTSLGGHPVLAGPDPMELLDRSIPEHAPDLVLDLSDEPVLDYRRRFALASISLHHGVPYQGADFILEPPARERVATKPSLAVIGTGKRTGKTAFAGFTARTLKDAGHRPAIVAMGRGGPAEPEILRGDEMELTPADLLSLADAGKHAASDYIEDALLGRVPTVGCRRCGGGLAGGVRFSNVVAGVAAANELPADILVLEGSGSAIPPVHADATILIVPADVPEEYLAGYLGLYRVLLADLAVITMSEDPFGSPSQISAIASRIQSSFRSSARGATGGIEVVRTVFRPSPTRPVKGATAVVVTTAPEAIGEQIRAHLEAEHGCRVVGISHALSDRSRLTSDLTSMDKQADTLLCEVKAAAVDVATRWAVAEEMQVVYMDNSPIGIDGDDPVRAVTAVADAAVSRFEEPA